MNYSRWHWLHPCGWLLWISVMSYVIFGPLAWLHSGTEISTSGLVTYSVLVLSFLAPLILIPATPLKISQLRYDRRYTYVLIAIYVVIAFLRVTSHSLDYEILRTAIGGSLFYLNFISWLLIFAVLTLPFISKYRGLQLLMVLAELTFLYMSGFREWLVVFFVGIILVFASSGIKIRWATFPILILIFLFAVSPLWYAQRSASSYLSGLSEAEREEVSDSKIYHTSRYFYSNYTDFILAASVRLGANGDASLRIINQVPENVPNYRFDIWGRQLNTIFVPRILWPEKPDYRPGEEVYTTFYDTDNDRKISHPAGFIGELRWLAGWWALLILPLFSSLLVMISNLFLKTSSSWLLIHFLLFFVFTESHLIFYLSAWLRVLPVYLIFFYFFKKYKF